MVSVCLPSDALSQHPPSYLGFSFLGCGISLQGCSSKAQPLLLTLNEGYLLTAAPPDLECGVAPLGPPVPAVVQIPGKKSKSGIISLEFMIRCLLFWYMKTPTSPSCFLSSWACITDWLRLGGLTNRNLFSHLPRDCMSKIKVLAGLISPETSSFGLQMAPGVGNRQGGLACCDSWGHKESDTTERLNWTELIGKKKKVTSHGLFSVHVYPWYLLLFL